MEKNQSQKKRMDEMTEVKEAILAEARQHESMTNPQLVKTEASEIVEEPDITIAEFATVATSQQIADEIEKKIGELVILGDELRSRRSYNLKEKIWKDVTGEEL